MKRAEVAQAVGRRVVIDVESDDVDAYLRVLREDGTPVTTDDDRGSGSNARVEFRAVLRGSIWWWPRVSRRGR